MKGGALNRSAPPARLGDELHTLMPYQPGTAGRVVNAEIFIQSRSVRMPSAIIAMTAMRMLAALPPRFFKLLPRHDLRLVRALFISIVGHAQRGAHPVDKGQRNRAESHNMAIRAFRWLAGFAHPSPGREFPAANTFIVISRHRLALPFAVRHCPVAALAAVAAGPNTPLSNR